jgi:hypothetical protein
MVSDRDRPSESFILAERLLSNLPGVISAKINTGPDGEIIEIHLLTDHNRAAKQIVRDVESALFTGFNIAVDHKRISVAQLRNPKGEQPERPEFGIQQPEPSSNDRSASTEVQMRLRFDRFEVVPSGSLKCRAEVILANAGHVYRGVCEDTNTSVNQMKISAKAVLSALEEYLRGEKAFTLDELKIIDEVSVPVVLVVIGVVSHDATDSLVGTSFVRGDRNRAAALATLKALNRYLGSR